MWQEKNQKLYKKFTFKDFVEALDFINRVGAMAEEHSHHPTIENTFNTVELKLSTHDAGDKVTEKDKKLAKAIDELLREEADEKEESTSPHNGKVKLYCDGGSRGNPGPSAAGYVLLNKDDQVIHKSGVYLGVTTNNQAEYQSLKFGLEEAQKQGAHHVDVFMDSMLVVNQMTGKFKIKNRDLWPIHHSIKELSQEFKKVNYSHVPRELNKLADAEVNVVLDAQKNT
ncbi:MAG: reverse transcriptase-like protein [Candidatus Saccharibacteria bacterium]|nr:reverse transcriptase-like protein [Candidatus Saccharibacteria bacterium]